MSYLIETIKASLESKQAVMIDLKVKISSVTYDIIAVGTIDQAFGISDQYDCKSAIISVIYCEVINGELVLAPRSVKNVMNEVEVKALLEQKMISNPELVAA